MNQLPERLINFMAYADGGRLAGVVDATLPEVNFMTETITGAGVGGNMTTPVLGMVDDMTASLNWRTIERAALSLVTPGIHALELRGAQQATDVASGQIKTIPVKVSMRVAPTGFTAGTLAVGATTGSASNFSVYQIKMWVDGVAVLEIDKANFICEIDGVDYLASVRANLGI